MTCTMRNSLGTRLASIRRRLPKENIVFFAGFLEQFSLACPYLEPTRVRAIASGQQRRSAVWRGVANRRTDEKRVFLTFGKNSWEVAFHHGRRARGAVLFRITPQLPDFAAESVLALFGSYGDVRRTFFGVTLNRSRFLLRTFRRDHRG